ncbi:MAG: hypothetical protein IJ104_02465, partial [Methanobrevibacter sp.]|nr:hypothetical protein [Methanobrevibacter sp.]
VLGYDHTYDVPISTDASQYLSQFKYVSSGLYINTSHTLSVFWTPIMDGVFYVVFDMHDGYIIKNQKGVNGLTYSNMEITQVGTSNVNVVKFTGVTQSSDDVSITLQRTGGPHVTISGIYAYYPTETSLTINNKLSDSVNVNTPVTLKPTVTSEFTTVGSNGVVNYYVKGPGATAFTKLSQTSSPTGSISYTPQTRGDYTFYAEYQENENDHLFASKSNEVTLNAIKLDSSSVSVADKTFDYGATVSTTITLINSTNIADVTVTGTKSGSISTFTTNLVSSSGNTKVYSIVFNNKLDADTYSIHVTNNVDTTMYVATSGTGSITVNKVDSTVSVPAMSFDYGASGSVTVTYDGARGITNVAVVNHPEAIISVNSNVVTVSGLDTGDYTLSVTTVADDNHNSVSGTGSITVNKVNSKVTITSITNGTFDGTAVSIGYVIVNRTSASYVVTNKLGSEVKSGVISSDEGTLTFSDLPAGNYTIRINNADSRNYYESGDIKSFDVYKSDDSGFSIKATPHTAYYDKIITVRSSVTNSNATGTVRYTFDDGTPDVVKNVGESFEYIPKLSGYRTITAVYSGDDNFNSANDEAEICVNKYDTTTSISLSTPEIVIGESITITPAVTYRDGSVNNGTLYIYVNGDLNKTITVDGGDMSFVYTPTATGELLITAEYVGYEKFENSGSDDSGNSKTLNVLNNFTIDLTVNNLKEVYIVADDMANLLATPNITVSGNVKLYINKSYDNLDLNLGSSYGRIFDTPGKYVAYVVYEADGVYTTVISNNVTINVAKANSSVTINDIPKNVYNNAVSIVYDIVNFTNAKFNVTDSAGDIVKSGDIQSANGILTFNDLAAGDYMISIVNYGSSKYNESDASKSFIVDKAHTNVTITSNDSVVFDNDVSVDFVIANINGTVVLPDFVAGEVTVIVDGISDVDYTVAEGNVVIRGLEAGVYDVVIAY